MKMEMNKYLIEKIDDDRLGLVIEASREERA